MVVVCHVKQITDRTAGTGLGIGRAVHHPGNPGVDDGTGAHGTGLQGYIQVAFPQPPAAKISAGFADGFQFRVAQGRLSLFPAVAAPADNFAPAGDDAAHGNLALGGGFSGQRQGFQHKITVFHIRCSLSKTQMIWL